MGRKVKISKVEEENRRETMKRGLKHGSIQNGIDKTLDKFGNPVSEKVIGVLKKAHDKADITEPAVDAFVKSSMLFGFAEVVNALSVLGTKVPGLNKIDEAKYEQLQAYLRGYAGQRAGTKTADGMFKIAPLVADMLANPALKDLLDENGDTSVPKLTEGNKSDMNLAEEIFKLKEDD